MNDQYGRRIHYLRVSVTDRCDLRCRYCMPEEGVEWLEHSRILSYEQIVRLVRAAAGLGIDTVRLTGGEPLVRKGLDKLVWAVKAIDGIRTVTLTTNGVLLAQQLPALRAAGLDPGFWEAFKTGIGQSPFMSVVTMAASMIVTPLANLAFSRRCAVSNELLERIFPPKLPVHLVYTRGGE